MPRPTTASRHVVLHPQGGPVRVEARAAVRWRVRAVVPCHNRPRDAEVLLGDLAALELPEGVELSVLLIDNASDEPLARLAPPAGLRLEHLRLERNTGGSGGFNAGMARVLADGVPCDARELVWLLDSDARPEPGTLRHLLTALEEDEEIVAAASALADPDTGEVYETGGRLDRRTGEYVQPAPAASVVEVEYAAACSLLARRWAVERAGPMSDVFVNGDDVEWCVRLARATGGRVVAVPASRARHPRPDRMRTWSRYYAARNAFVPMGAVGCGARARLRRALREVGRAMAQVMVGRDDLAALHVRGLRDAAAGVTTGPMPPGLRFEPARPLDQLGPAVREALAGSGVRRAVLGRGLGADEGAVVAALRRLAVVPGRSRQEQAAPWSAGRIAGGLWRLVAGARADLAIVSARARPEDWMAGRVLVTVWPEGFVVRRVRRLDRLRALVSVAFSGLCASLRLARRGPRYEPPRGWAVGTRASAGSLSVVVLSHKRWAALERTLDALSREPALADPSRAARVIVADNASGDGTPERLRERFPAVDLLPLDRNAGVAAYNLAVERASSDYVLILDDDAWPDREGRALEHALGLLDRRPDVAAVCLHPRHPGTAASEWPFAEAAAPTDAWPFMGCGNLVRREAWARVGGYEGAFFLYRNDTDLALKLLGAGLKVHFDPAWVVWHDSPAAARKPARWFELATRNWVWLCRRHGRGLTGLAALAAGWAWTHRLAGWRPTLHWRVLKGVAAGLLSPPPPLPDAVRPTGGALARLLRLRRAGRSG